MEPSAASTTVTGPVGERLQAGIEDAPVFNYSVPLIRFHDSGAGYKYPDLLTYYGSFLTLLVDCVRRQYPPSVTCQCNAVCTILWWHLSSIF